MKTAIDKNTNCNQALLATAGNRKVATPIHQFQIETGCNTVTYLPHRSHEDWYPGTDDSSTCLKKAQAVNATMGLSPNVAVNVA